MSVVSQHIPRTMVVELFLLEFSTRFKKRKISTYSGLVSSASQSAVQSEKPNYAKQACDQKRWQPPRIEQSQVNTSFARAMLELGFQFELLSNTI